jgi:dipeptidyl-peptidase-4
MACKLLIAVSCLAMTASFAAAQPLPKPQGLSMERLYSYPSVNGRSPSQPAMAPDGSHIVYGWNQTGARKLDLWVMDYPSGRARMIVEAAKINDFPRQDDDRKELEKKEAALYDGGIGGATWSPDGKELLFNYKGRTWLVDADGRNLRPIFDGGMSFGNAQYSPSGRYISFNSGANLFRYERKTGQVKQLTFLNKPNQSISSHEWSDDEKSIAVSWSDEGKVGNHVMMDFSKDRAEVVNIKRDWNGELSENVQVGVISADGGVVRFVPDLPHSLWLIGFGWSPDSRTLEVNWIKEDFQEYTISMVDPVKLVKTDVYHEKAPSNYIPDWRPVIWTRDNRVLFGTDIIGGQFGYRSVMQMDRDGRNLKKFFAEDYDVAALGRPKHSDRVFLSTLSRSELTCEITIVEPDGKRTVHVVVPDGFSVPNQFDDAGLPLYSEDGRMVATMASTRKLSPELYAVEPRQERLTKSQLPEWDQIKWADVKQVSFPAPDGKTIQGLLITKPGLDMSRPHPAFISNIYANSAKESWSGFTENYAAMELDMVVLCVDFRGSWGQGGEFNSGYYRKMGLVDVDEAVAAKNYLASLPYVRGDRVGIWGWSYGGYLTCMTLLTKPGVFYAGVAVAPVTDWKSYNEWYTRRRLGLVKDDKEIFEKTSPITYASGLKDNLLLVHGMLDDNVLFQDTARLIQAFIDNGKYFEELTYPRDDHSIGKDTSRPHVRASIMTYLYDKLTTP